MGDFAHVVETEGAAAALDRMRRTENRVQIFCIRLGDIERQQQAFHFCQMFFRFVEEQLMKLT